MGDFLTTPIKDKHSEDKENGYVKINNIASNWCLWDARLEKENGRLTHCIFVSIWR